MKKNVKVDEEVQISPNLLKIAKNSSKVSGRKTKVRFSQERITNFGAKDEDMNDVDEENYINNVNAVIHNPTKSATKCKL
jgi:hypothetical protein